MTRVANVEPDQRQRLDSKIWLSVEDAAFVLSMTRTRIFQLIATNELSPTLKDGRRRLIPASSVEAYAKKREALAFEDDPSPAAYITHQHENVVAYRARGRQRHTNSIAMRKAKGSATH